MTLFPWQREPWGQDWGVDKGIPDYNLRMAFVYTMIDNIPKKKQWLNFEREVVLTVPSFTIIIQFEIIIISNCTIWDFLDSAQNKFGPVASRLIGQRNFRSVISLFCPVKMLKVESLSFTANARFVCLSRQMLILTIHCLLTSWEYVPWE